MYVNGKTYYYMVFGGNGAGWGRVRILRFFRGYYGLRRSNLKKKIRKIREIGGCQVRLLNPPLSR